MRLYYEKLGDYRTVERRVHGHRLYIMVEATRDGFVHACTPDDISHLLSLLPQGCIDGQERLAAVVLRQPTKKQNALTPVWGRLCYSADVGTIHGPMVFLEAQPIHSFCVMPLQLSTEQQGELERMEQLLERTAGTNGRSFDWGIFGLRRWLLYHTLIHELGHWSDYLTKVVAPSLAANAPQDPWWEEYKQRPKSEREAYAHRFSDEWRDTLAQAGHLPFARRFDEEQLIAEGLDPEWFQGECPKDNAAGPAIIPRIKDRKSRLEPPA